MISEQVDQWILEDEMPVGPGLKVIRQSAGHFDPCEGMDEDDREAYWEFINWYVNREHLSLSSLPTPVFGKCFIEPDDAISFPFGSIDFQRNDGFNAKNWKLNKIFDRVKDLAEMHSCLSTEQGRQNTFDRYKNLVEREFRDKAVLWLETFQKYPQWVNKAQMLEKIGECNAHIRKCKAIWRKHAYRS